MADRFRAPFPPFLDRSAGRSILISSASPGSSQAVALKDKKSEIRDTARPGRNLKATMPAMHASAWPSCCRRFGEDMMLDRHCFWGAECRHHRNRICHTLTADITLQGCNFSTGNGADSCYFTSKVCYMVKLDSACCKGMPVRISNMRAVLGMLTW